MIPLRKAAAQRIVTAIVELTDAIDCLNATGLCLRETGTRAVLMPQPLLNAMQQIARSILEAETPQQERN